MLSERHYSLIAGFSYLIIFFSAIYANFFVLEAISENPLLTVQQNSLSIRLGIIAFLITVTFDVVVAWALYQLFKNHPLIQLSTLFRMMHAAIMGVAIFALPGVLHLTTPQDILSHTQIFETIWLIGLFFFGIHLVLLSSILLRPRIIALFLLLAGIMYVVDTSAHFLLSNYEHYASLFLALVAIPSIIGEMSLAVWLLRKGLARSINASSST